MPVSPALTEGLAEPVLRLYLEAELILLRAVARRLARGITEPGWAEMKLLEVNQLRIEVEAQVARLSVEGRGEVEAAVREAWGRGEEAATADLRRAERAGRPGIASRFFGVNQGAVAALAGEAARAVEATHFRILRSTVDAYRAVVADASGQVLTGSLTRREAAQSALDRLMGRGITGFVDSAGRSWGLAEYTEMATRTASGHAAVQGHVDKLSAAGYDLVIVSNAPGECNRCRPWESRVLSSTGQTPGYPTLSQARGDGLFHPHCRHSVGTYLSGITQPETGTADPAGDAARQQQRYLERQIRLWKRRESLALDPATQREARAEVLDWQARIRQRVEATSGQRLYYRESITAAH